MHAQKKFHLVFSLLMGAMKDMIKWHGHDCEGTIHAANAAKVAFGLLFPDGIIDRSVLGGISGTGACWSDAVAFLTGARVQYGNLAFFKSKDYGHAILLYRQDTGMAVLATWKKGINNIPGEPVVLPGAITWTPKMSMEQVTKLKMAVKVQKTPTPYQVDLMRYQQFVHVNDILERPLEESYLAQVIPNFKPADWVDPGVAMKPIARTDIELKNFENRGSRSKGRSLEATGGGYFCERFFVNRASLLAAPRNSVLRPTMRDFEPASARVPRRLVF